MVERRVKHLRTNMTDAERKLWRALRAGSVGAKFRRQVSLGPYIVDFVCFDLKLILEVDGSQHATSRRDVLRDEYFEKQGYRVMRFWNNDVLRNLDGVLSVIVGDPSPDTPLCGVSPSPSRGEGCAADAARSDA